MAKYSAQLHAKSNQNKNVTTTLSNVNPEADAADILEFAQTLNELTTNTYSATDYIVTTNLDTETPPVPAQTPTMLLCTSEYTGSAIEVGGTVEGVPISGWSGSKQLFANYNGDGYLYVEIVEGCEHTRFLVSSQRKETSGGDPNFFIIQIEANGTSSGQSKTAGKFILHSTATANYKALAQEYNMAVS